MIASDRQLINGNNNLVINSSDVEMYGSENTVLQLNTLKQKQTNHLIKGNENVLDKTLFSSIIGNQNFIQNQKLVNFEKSNQMKMKGQIFWKNNDHQSEKMVYAEADKILNIPYLKAKLQ